MNLDGEATGAVEESRQRILLVDDIELNCILTAAVLERAGYVVDSVQSGVAALAAVETQHYDLILLDIEMPGLSGHEAAALLKKREAGGTRLAALTFRADPAARDRSRELGLVAHLSRPLKPADLVRAVADILRQPTSDGDPWQREVYRDFVARLGVERMHGFLGRLSDQFAILSSQIDRPDADEDMHRLAHDIASVGGMLGFMQASLACRSVMASRGTPEEDEARAGLRSALVAARQRLDTHLETVEPKAA